MPLFCCHKENINLDIFHPYDSFAYLVKRKCYVQNLPWEKQYLIWGESASSTGLGIPISWWYIDSIKLPVEDKATTLGLLCCVYHSDLSYQFIIYGSILKLPYWIGGWDLSHSFLLLMQTKILLTWQIEFPFLCITQRQKFVLQTIEYQIENGIQ